MFEDDPKNDCYDSFAFASFLSRLLPLTSARAKISHGLRKTNIYNAQFKIDVINSLKN